MQHGGDESPRPRGADTGWGAGPRESAPAPTLQTATPVGFVSPARTWQRNLHPCLWNKLFYSHKAAHTCCRQLGILIKHSLFLTLQTPEGDFLQEPRYSRYQRQFTVSPVCVPSPVRERGCGSSGPPRPLPFPSLPLPFSPFPPPESASCQTSLVRAMNSKMLFIHSTGTSQCSM